MTFEPIDLDATAFGVYFTDGVTSRSRAGCRKGGRRRCANPSGWWPSCLPALFGSLRSGHRHCASRQRLSIVDETLSATT